MQIHGQTAFAGRGGGERIGINGEQWREQVHDWKDESYDANVRRSPSRYIIKEREDYVPSEDGLIWEPPCPCALTDRGVTLAFREEDSKARSRELTVDFPSIGAYG